jgi:hypothetical protein
MAIPRGHMVGLAAAVVLALAGVAGLVTVATSGQQPGAARSATSVDNPTQGPRPPAHGAYFGARVRGTAYTDSADIAAVDRLQQDIGRRLAIVHVYHLWQDPFPSPSDLTFLRQGSTLLLSWSGTDTRAIAAGSYDSMIRQRARAIKSSSNGAGKWTAPVCRRRSIPRRTTLRPGITSDPSLPRNT